MKDITRDRPLFDSPEFVDRVVEIALIALCAAASIYGLTQLSAIELIV